MKYPCTVFQTQVEGHLFWIADSPYLKGCTGQGESAEEALAELAENEKQWLEIAEKYGIIIPPIPIEEVNIYSGKFTARVAPYVHRAAAEFAKKQNISLNQYVNDAIVSQNARMSTIDYIAPEVKEAARSFKSLFFDAPATISVGKETVSLFGNARTQNRYTIAENQRMI